MPDRLAPVRCPDCRGCGLWEGVHTVCVPSASVYGEESWPASYVAEEEKIRALFIIGEAPGYNEDIQGIPFIGKAGNTLRRLYIDHYHFSDMTDVYLSNAVRCRPPGNRNPTAGQLKACQGFYLADILNLQRLYKEVIILCVGATATESVLGMSLKQSLARQGDLADFRALTSGKGSTKTLVRVGEIVGPYLDSPTDPPFPAPCRVFTTYHPSAINRDPNRGLALKRHLDTLRDYLQGNLSYAEEGGGLSIQTAPLPPAYPISRLSLDIETYGILEGQNQRMFHPLKSEVHDGIPRDKLVVTTGLTWNDPLGQEQHAIFIMSHLTHRKRLWAWVQKVRNDSTFVCLEGQNIKFDIAYLRHAYPECRHWLNHPLPLADLIIANYLLDEGRPERSLKAVAPLLRITKYADGGKFRQYPSEDDPALHQYNCQDTMAVHRALKIVEQDIRDFYGSGTSKLSEFSRRWYSDLLWLLIWMEETGITMDESHLQTLLTHHTSRLGRLERGIEKRWGIHLRGKGSDGFKRDIMENAVAAVVRDPDQIAASLKQTTVRKEISFCVENRNALLEVLPPDSQSYAQLKAIGRVHDVGGILDRYLRPVLRGRKKGTDPSTLLIDGVVYPHWYPVPSDWEDGSSGGTKQARIVAKGPPCQTFPSSIKKCITGCFPGGWLVWADYSQIELRIAALLSGDPWMMGAYRQEGSDLHRATAAHIFGEDQALRYRQVGKTLNFLVIYLGGALQYQTTLMRDEGISRSLSQCQADIDAFWQAAAGLRSWQHSVIQFVHRHDYYELPLIGQSRLFLGGKTAKDRSTSEIVNMPVQAIAADIMLSAQFHLWWEFQKAGLKASLPLNIYDAVAIQCPHDERYAVEKIMGRVLPNPPYYDALCTELGRRLPLKCDMKFLKVST
jgi:uracil-DNA glycosylase family 4